VVSLPPRPSVVISFVLGDTPWKPATITTWPASSAARMRSGFTPTMRALAWRSSVKMPLCEPVNEMAFTPRSWSAMATSAMDTRSPVVTSMSSSRRDGCGETWWASAISSSVVSPMALTTTTIA
jgi:hypothetical protein